MEQEVVRVTNIDIEEFDGTPFMSRIQLIQISIKVIYQAMMKPYIAVTIVLLVMKRICKIQPMALLHMQHQI